MTKRDIPMNRYRNVRKTTISQMPAAIYIHLTKSVMILMMMMFVLMVMMMAVMVMVLMMVLMMYMIMYIMIMYVMMMTSADNR